MTDLTKLTLSEARDAVAPQRLLCGQRRESPSPRRGGVRGGVTSLVEGGRLAQIFFLFLTVEAVQQFNFLYALGVTPNPSPQGQGYRIWLRRAMR